MAFGFDTIFSAVEVAFEAATGSSVAFLYGEQARHTHDADGLPPAIIVLHRGGQHQPTDSKITGGASAGAGVSYEEARTNPVHVSHAVERFRFEARGATDEDAYDLWLQVCSILKSQCDAAGWVVELGAFGWTTEQPQIASPMLAWSEKWQDFTLTTVVPKLWPPAGGTLQTTVTVELTDHVVSLVDDVDDTPTVPEGCEHNTPDDPFGD